MSFFNSISQFSAFRFSPWSKKNPSNQSRELGQKSFLQSEISAFNTRYSNGNILSFWYWSQAIQKPKFIYVSRTTTLMRIQSEINSFSITELQPNSAGNLLAARFYVFTLDFKQEYLEFLISKSSNSKFKFIYVSWTTNLMKELKWDKIILENKICQ